MMMKIALTAVSFCLLCCLAAEATSGYKFDIVRSAQFQIPGGLVKYTLTITVPESTSLKIKVKMPFKTTAILRLTKIEVTHLNSLLKFSGSKRPAMTSTAGDKINDIALIDFGNVTRQSSIHDTNIVIKFEAQILDNKHVVHGGLQWVSVGTEYKNSSSVWVAQLAVKTVNSVSARPDLEVTFMEYTSYKNPFFGDGLQLRVHVFHSINTSAEVQSGVIELMKPGFLIFDRSTGFSRTNSYTMTANEKNLVRFEFGKLGFADELNFAIHVKLDPSKSKADGKIHHLTTYLNVKYNGPADSACASPSSSRTYSVEKSISNHLLFYAPRTECDDALGMQDGRIQDGQITASSYYPKYPPYMARLNKYAVWLPNTLQNYNKEKNQFIQVNFTTKMKITRIAIQGRHAYYNHYVKKFSVYCSDDGVIWTPYQEGSLTKVFDGTHHYITIHLVVLSIPIVTKLIRIRPLKWQGDISLRLEFYGCESFEQLKTPTLKYASRGYMLEKKSNVMYVCNNPMERRKHASTCFFSADQGLTWKAIDYRMIYILGYDPETKLLYGVANNLKTVMRSTQDHADKFIMVEEKHWNLVRSKATTVVPTELEARDIVVTDDTSPDSPPVEHQVTADGGTKWAASAFGIHVYDVDVWKQRLSWQAKEY